MNYYYLLRFGQYFFFGAVNAYLSTLRKLKEDW